MLTQYLHQLVGYIGDHPIAALVIVFLVSAGEAVIVLGLFVPSTVVLVGAGTLIGMGKLPFLPIFVASAIGATVGDALSYQFGHIYKEHVRQIWPFSRYTGLIDKGGAFFARHGGKSVFIGRFIPAVKAVVPGVAGIAGMDPWRFTAINVVSAFAWTATHLLPGMGIGRTVGVASTSNPRLLEAALAAAVVVVLGWYLTKFLVVWMLPHLERWHGRAVNVLRRQSLPGAATAARLLANEEGILVPFVLAAVAAGALIGFALMAVTLVVDPELARADAAISGYVQSLRTPLFDKLMIAVTMFGDGTVIAPTAIAAIAVIAWSRRWRLAGAVAIAFAGAAAFVLFIKWGIHRARPMELYAGADSFSFPSGHATLSAVVLGITLLIAASAFRPKIRLAIFLIGATVVSLIGFSRIYLMAHWPSDVAAGLLFGGAMSFLVAWLLYEKPIAAVAARIGAAILVVMAVAYPVHLYTGYAKAEAKYTVPDTTTTMTRADWLAGGWQRISDKRILLDGDYGEPFVVQTDITLEGIGVALTGDGWTHLGTDQAGTLVNAVLPTRTPGPDPVALPLTHRGRPPIAVFVKPLGNDRSAFLRLWKTDFLVGDGATAHPLFVASVTAEKRDQLPLGFSLPEPAELGPRERERIAAHVADIAAAKASSSIVRRESLALVPASGS